jgi:hypothetical protein
MSDAARVLAGDQDTRMNLIWMLYEMTYEFMGVDTKSLIKGDEFFPEELVVPREHLEIVLNAMGNVIAAISYRDAALQEWFVSQMRMTWKKLAEDAKRRQQ